MKTNWQIKKLGEVCKLQGGFAFKSGDYKSVGVPLVRIQNLQDNLIDTHKAVFISDNKKDELKNFLLKEDDILIAMSGATTGKMAVVKKTDLPIFLNQRVGRFIVDIKLLDNSYLWYFLNLIKDSFLEQAYGGAQPNISPSKIENLEIPLPPLKIQKEIVAKLDTKFTKLKEAKRLREEALADTEKILSQTLRQIFEEGKQKGWDEKELHDICEIAGGGSPRPIQSYLTDSEDGINWIKISDATSSDKYIYKTRQKITKEGLHKTRMVYPGDFILTNSMSFGRPYIMKIEGAIHDGWLLLRPNKSISEEYLYYFLSSNDIYRQFKELAGGAVVQNLNSALVRNIKILIPSIAEQQKIVTKLDKLSEKIRTFRELQTSQLTDLKRLEKSYLREAFNGELI